MKKYIAWIPNTLGKISLSRVRSIDSPYIDNDDFFICTRDIYSSDAYTFTPFIGGYYVEKFLNLVAYLLQLPLIYLLNFIIRNILGKKVEFLPERKIFTVGLNRYLSKSKFTSIGGRSSADFKYVLILRKNKNNNGFYEDLEGRIYAFALRNFFLWSFAVDDIVSEEIFKKLNSKSDLGNGDSASATDLDIPNSFNFSTKIKIHRSGLCTLEDLKIQNRDQNDTDDITNGQLLSVTDERFYQQIFYFVKECFHSHKHHTDHHDTILSAYEYDPIKVDYERKEIKSSWIKNITYGLMRCAIMQKNDGNYYDAKGISDYTSSFINVVELAYAKNYPKLDVNPQKESKHWTSTENSFSKDSSVDDDEFKVVHYILGNIDTFNSNLETLNKKFSTSLSVSTAIKNKIFSRLTFMGLFLIAALAFSDGEEDLAMLKELIMSNIVIISLTLLSFFVALDMVYSDKTRPSLILKNFTDSYFTISLKGLFKDGHLTLRKHRSLMVFANICWYLLSRTVITFTTVIYDIVVFAIETLYRTFRYILSIYNYPNK